MLNTYVTIATFSHKSWKGLASPFHLWGLGASYNFMVDFEGSVFEVAKCV